MIRLLLPRFYLSRPNKNWIRIRQYNRTLDNSQTCQLALMHVTLRVQWVMAKKSPTSPSFFSPSNNSRCYTKEKQDYDHFLDFPWHVQRFFLLLLGRRVKLELIQPLLPLKDQFTKHWPAWVDLQVATWPRSNKRRGSLYLELPLTYRLSTHWKFS